MSDNRDSFVRQQHQDLANKSHHGAQEQSTILAKTTDYTLIILPDDYVPNQTP